MTSDTTPGSSRDGGAARLLGRDAIVGVVADVGLDALLDQLIDRLRQTCATFDPDRIRTFDRAGFRYDRPDLGLLEWMPAMELGRSVAIKTVGYHPSNPIERGVPSVLATTSLHDTTSGRLIALCEATFLTALRTGAASAVASDVLARPSSTRVGVIGCGAQAVTQVHALSRVLPIERVLAFDIDPRVSATFPARVRRHVDVAVEPIDDADLRRLVGSVDVLVTATSVDIGAGPVFGDGDHVPWLHVNAVGADFPGKHEVPVSMLHRALVCPDVTGQCLLEGEAQRLAADRLGPDLAGLVRERERWSSSRDELTVFDSTGWAVADLVAAGLLLDHAERLGLGALIELQPPTGDPYDPYDLLRSG